MIRPPPRKGGCDPQVRTTTLRITSVGSFVPVDPLCTGQEEQESKALASWTNKTGKACPLGGVQGRCVLLYNILGNHKSQTGGKTHTKKYAQNWGMQGLPRKNNRGANQYGQGGQRCALCGPPRGHG